ncbi:TrkA family potassium uptake protein [bacterium]|nr:TrkA family potassium uptake protein [bacterium]
MFIIVAGAGTNGRLIIELLVSHKHDVVVIDIDREVCESVYAKTGATTVHGSATDIQILREAGAEKADVVVTLLRYDADNIACALLSRSLKVPKIISRLNNPVYTQAYKLAGVNSLVRVADLLLNQIVMEIEQPKARKILSFGRGKATLYAVKIPPKSMSIGKTIRELTHERNFPSDVVFTGIYHEESDEFMIPRGNHIVNEEDLIFVVSTEHHIKKATDILTE